MRFDDDTICAIATAMSDAGIGIIRISGKDAVSIVDKFYLSAKKVHNLREHAPNTIEYGYICDNEENILDEVMISFMKAPHSYTREDVIEINTHGGMMIMNEILELLISNGCRLADPGEFTKRAFLNGRIDLTKAEAVMDIISAQNKFALHNSEKQLRGEVYNVISELRKKILYEMAYIESALDDPENYDLDGYKPTLLTELKELSDKCMHLINSSDEGKIRKDGINTVIIGKPNAGKSSLLNIMTGEERAIVTDIAGTTRDIIEETVRMDDIILHIIDTAGIRNTDDTIEKIGVDKAKKYANDAELIIYLIDSTKNLTSDDYDIIDLIKNKKVIVLLNKSDLGNQIVSKDDVLSRFESEIPIINTSMTDMSGIEEMKQAISNYFLDGSIVPKQELYITNMRHQQALRKTYDSISLVIQSINDDMSEDFFTVDLMNAYASLGEIIGEEVGDDLVEEIFSKFCMGK
ncbi:MAG: tRNA uridine-5-carboxymethylaminomethyl(34) synthesis GTPase MnmE [Butyrivibrio sp.]|nr:tRNA uridine-5-carboxymethylaminomethyl(34) synthesis GTPase MnmE [Butyrivibrio sp.]